MCKKTIFEEISGFHDPSWEKGAIPELSERWIAEVKSKYDGIERNLYLGRIFLIRSLNTGLDFGCLEQACDYYERVPVEYYCKHSDALENYVFALKQCYRFATVVTLLREILDSAPAHPFVVEYFCLDALADDGMVADGAITKEECQNYRNCCLELLKKQMQRIERKL